jgi:hypothetical protein
VIHRFVVLHFEKKERQIFFEGKAIFFSDGIREEGKYWLLIYPFPLRRKRSSLAHEIVDIHDFQTSCVTFSNV